MKITWLGHACFLVEDSKGTRVLTDPFDINPLLFADRGLKFDYPPISGVQADLVLISHEHFDHNAAGVVEGFPIIIRRTGKFAIAGVSGVAVNFLQPVDNFLELMNQVEEKGTTSVEISPNQVLSLSLTVFVLDSPKEAYKNEH